MYTTTMPLRAAFASILIAGTLLATACGEESADADVTTTKPATTEPAAPPTTEHHVTAPPATEPPVPGAPTTEPPATEPEATFVEVHAADYGFGGLPPEIAAGTELRL